MGSVGAALRILGTSVIIYHLVYNSNYNFLNAVLLKYSYTTQFSYLKFAIQWFLVYSQSYAAITHPNQFFNIFITSQGKKHKTCPLVSVPLKPPSFPPEPWPSARQPLIFLFLQICLFWTFHVSRIIQYVIYCDRFLSFGIIFQSSSMF